MILVRDARTRDAPTLVQLIALLGHETAIKGVADRLGRPGLRDLVADRNGTVLGLCGLHLMTAVHREAPVGRITILVVAEGARGEGIGRMLTDAAERRLREAGCELIEVTSNDRLSDAHGFYRHMGYERTSQRFAKML